MISLLHQSEHSTQHRPQVIRKPPFPQASLYVSYSSYTTLVFCWLACVIDQRPEAMTFEKSSHISVLLLLNVYLDSELCILRQTLEVHDFAKG